MSRDNHDIWDDAAAEVTGRGGATMSLANAAGINPDEEAKIQRNARIAGIPVETARAMPHETRQQAGVALARDPELEAALRASPTASRWLSRYDNAAVAHDDVGVLAKVANLVAPRLVSAFPVLGMAGVATVAKVSQSGYTANALRVATSHPENYGRTASGAVDDLMWGVGGLVHGTAELYDTYSPEAWAERKVFGGSLAAGIAEFANRRRQYWAKASKDNTVITDSPLMNDVFSGLRSIPASLLAAGVTLATDNPYAGAAVMGGITGGQSYGEARDDGLSPGKAARMGHGSHEAGRYGR